MAPAILFLRRQEWALAKWGLVDMLSKAKLVERLAPFQNDLHVRFAEPALINGKLVLVGLLVDALHSFYESFL